MKPNFARSAEETMLKAVRARRVRRRSALAASVVCAMALLTVAFWPTQTIEPSAMPTPQLASMPADQPLPATTASYVEVATKTDAFQLIDTPSNRLQIVSTDNYPAFSPISEEELLSYLPDVGLQVNSDGKQSLLINKPR